MSSLDWKAIFARLLFWLHTANDWSWPRVSCKQRFDSSEKWLSHLIDSRSPFLVSDQDRSRRYVFIYMKIRVLFIQMNQFLWIQQRSHDQPRNPTFDRCAPAGCSKNQFRLVAIFLKRNFQSKHDKAVNSVFFEVSCGRYELMTLTS